MTSATVLRLQVLVAEYGRMAFRALVVLAVLSAAGSAYVLATPQETEVTTTSDRTTVTAAVDHGAVVTANDSVWPEGTRLTDRSAYLLGASPDLRLNATTAVPANRSATVDHRLSLVVTASRDGEPFYTETRPLAADRTTVEDGTASLTATVNASALGERLAALRQEVGPAATVDATLRYETDYDTTRYEGNLTATGSLVVGPQTYYVDGPVSDERPHTTSTTTTRTERDADTALSLLLLAVVSAAAAATVRVYSDRDLDREQLVRDLHAARMSEWISDGEVPVQVGDEHVRLESLLDLVDIGIDNDKRVVHDQRRDLYAVVDGSVVYYYAEDTTWWESSLPRMGGDTGAGTDGATGPEEPPGGPGAGGDGQFGMGDFEVEGDD
jgi:hypothetical protein